MDFPKDGGLSCVRHFLEARDPILEEYALAPPFPRFSSPGRLSGSLVCQCNAWNSWRTRLPLDASFAVVICGCNGSSLPIYIGAPPTLQAGQRLGTNYCPNQHETDGAMAVGIGYPGAVPELGTLEVERAQELTLAVRCRRCDTIFLAFHLRLPAPPTITGREPWVKGIQGLRSPGV
jgi:hypothetical protein